MERSGNIMKSCVYRTGYVIAVLFKRPFNGVIHNLFPVGFLQFKRDVLFRMYSHCNQHVHFRLSTDLKGHGACRSGCNYVIISACFYGKPVGVLGNFAPYAVYAVKLIVFAEKFAAVDFHFITPFCNLCLTRASAARYELGKSVSPKAQNCD